MMDTRRQLRNLVKTIEAAGGEFRRRTRFMEVELSDSTAHLRDTVMENIDAIYQLVFPPKTVSARKKRITCQVCKSGTGCRRRAAIRQYDLCPGCGHWCRSHYLPYEFPGGMFPGGCQRWMQDGSTMTRCTCPGWPVAPVRTRRKKAIHSLENFMPLFPTEELQHSHDKYAAEQARISAAGWSAGCTGTTATKFRTRRAVTMNQTSLYPPPVKAGPTPTVAKLARHHVASMLDVLWHEFADGCYNDIDERQYIDAVNHVVELEELLGEVKIQEIEDELLTQFVESQADDTPERKAKRLLFVEWLGVLGDPKTPGQEARRRDVMQRRYEMCHERHEEFRRLQEQSARKSLAALDAQP